MALVQKLADLKLDGFAETLTSARQSLTFDAKSEFSLDVQVNVGLGGVFETLNEAKVDAAALEAAIRETLEKLQELAAIPEIRTAGTIKESFAGMAAMLALAAQRAADPEQLIRQISGGTAGLPEILDDVVARFLASISVDLPDEIKVPFEGLEMLAAGELDAAQLADFLVRFLIGIDLESLRAPSIAIDAAVNATLAVGGDFSSLTARIASLTATIRATARMLHVAQPDIPAVLLALANIRGDIDALLVELESALTGLAAGLENFDTASIVLRLEAALAPFTRLVPNLTFDLNAATIEPLRALDNEIAAFDEARVDAMFAEVEAQLKAALASSGIGQLDELLENYRLLLIDRIRAIRIGRFRDEIVAALSAAEARISGFGVTAADDFFELLGNLQTKIETFDPSAITTSIGAAAAQVQTMVDTIHLDTFAKDLKDKLTPVNDLVQEFLGELEKIQAQLDALTQQVEAMDFAAAADEARRIMGEIRSTLETMLSLPELPAAARLAIAAAAEPLKGVNLRVDVGEKVSDALGRFDPSELLAPIEDALEQLRAALQSVVPAAIVAELDPPFLTALAALERYRPAALLAAADAQFAQATELLDRIDPRPLVTPLQSEFDKLVTSLRAKANPDPLFKPLEDVYAKILAGLDAVDAEKLLGVIAGKVAEIPSQLGARLEAAVQEQTGNIAELTGTAEPFKFGDLIRPFALLVEEIRSRVAALPEPAIRGALTVAIGPLAAMHALLDPDDGYLARVAAAIDARVALLVGDSGQGPMADLMMALHELEVTVAAQTQLSATVQLELAGGVASVKLDARLELMAQLRARLDLAVVTVRGNLAPPSLVAQLRRVATAIDDLVPEAWLDIDVDASLQQLLDALFAGLDLTPAADELDAIGERVRAKLATLAAAIARGVVRAVGVVFDAIEGVMPDGLSVKLRAFMDAIRAEIAGLDPAPIKAEMNRLLDSVVFVLARFSPTAIAARLGAVLDALKAKLETLKPSSIAAPVAEPLEQALDKLAEQRPSLIFADLVKSSEELKARLDKLLDLKLGDALLKAVVELRATIELAVDDLTAEFEALLELLEGSGGANVSVSLELKSA